MENCWQKTCKNIGKHDYIAEANLSQESAEINLFTRKISKVSRHLIF